MAVAQVLSRAELGLAAPLVHVEVHLAAGLPSFTLVGLPAPVVRESRERVRAAIVNSGYDFPPGRITVNLAPVDLAKEGGRYDLPIALGLLVASGQTSWPDGDVLECYGELGLSGELKPVGGLFPAALAAARDGHRMVLPIASVPETARASGIPPLGFQHLREVCEFLGLGVLPPVNATIKIKSPAIQYDSLDDVLGQWSAKRALCIAAAGGHSLLLSGPPGSGKSLLASRIARLLPPLSESEALEVASVRSISNGQVDPAQWGIRPFRAPHHSASASAMLGGGPRLAPGEISLAHRGVLFLDEFPEFDRRVLESLREPLESGHITLARAAGRLELPAEFQLVAAMNGCPCGQLGDPDRDCRCTPRMIERYRARLSGPLWDRIDLRVDVPRQPLAELLPGVTDQPIDAKQPATANQAELQQQVCRARDRQQNRSGCLNARLPAHRLVSDCALDAASRALLERSQKSLKLSGRGLHRLLRVARTIADLQDCDRIGSEHLAEAIQLRRAPV